MANYTFLQIIAFGAKEDLIQFDKSPPKFKGPDISIYSNKNSRTIETEIKSQVATEVLYGLIDQMQDLSLLIDIDTEPGYAELLYREKYNHQFKNLFEIPDYRDDEFFTNFNPSYFEKFDKIELSPNITRHIEALPTGKTYLNLTNNPNHYKNITKIEISSETIKVIEELKKKYPNLLINPDCNINI